MATDSEPQSNAHGPELREELVEMWRRLREEKDERWQRTLPFADYLVDRWEKARLLGFGEGSSIYDSSLVFGDVTVGENTWIGPFTILDGSGGGLSIGSHCSISAGVQIYTHDSVRRAISGGQAGLDQAPTKIGDHCYLVPNVVVAKGVAIGDGCVIGACSLVLENIPAGSKAYGTPCKVVGPVDLDDPGRA